MLFVNKYTPKSIDDSLFHNDILDKMKSMAKDDSLPHMIFYGPVGSGKKTLVNMFLEMIFDGDRSVHHLADTTYTINTNSMGTTRSDVSIKQSNYHIIIEPHTNNLDRYLIQDIVKEYAKRTPSGMFYSKRNFKIVVINNIDQMSYSAQTSLRRTMETFSHICRFIMVCKTLSKVIDPLKSRCYCMRVPGLGDFEITKLIATISYHEKLQLTLDDYLNIIKLSKYSAKNALWLLEMYSLNIPIVKMRYEITVDRITELILIGKLENILEIRKLYYELLVANFDNETLLQDITERIIQSNTVSEELKFHIIQFAAEASHRLVTGRRDIIHIEWFYVHIMNKIHEIVGK